MATPAAGTPWLMDSTEIDAVLALVDEVADVFPPSASNDTAALPTPLLSAVQALPDVSKAGPSAASGDSKSGAATGGGKELGRREKARQKERRRYYRNKERMSDLQRQVEMLECQLWALSTDTSGSDDLDAASTTVEQQGDATEAESGAQAATALSQRRFANAIRVTAQLRNENTLLRHKFREESHRLALLGDLLNAEHKLYLAGSTHFRLLKPVTPRVCAAIHSDSINTVAAFEQQMAGVEPFGGCLAGWRETRQVEGPLFRFKLSKTVCNFTSRAVFTRFWAMLQDPMRYARLYSDELHAEARLLQKVDDNNLVFYEEMRWMDASGANVGCAKAVLLLSRLETPNGYRIQMRGLDRDEIVVEDLHAGNNTQSSVVEVWNTSEMLWWIDFDSGDDGCVVSFAGTTSTAVSPLSFWATEVMRISLRGEHATIGARFSLPE